MLKRKFPSVDKPLRILAPPKISPSESEFYGIRKFNGKHIRRYYYLKVLSENEMVSEMVRADESVHMKPIWSIYQVIKP